MLSGLAGTATAVDYTDITEHWTEATLVKAVQDGLLKGYDDSTLRPDDPITGAEVVEVLIRVFSSEQTSDLSTIADIVPDDWYYKAASTAVALGIITPMNDRLNLDTPITRSKAFAALASCFQLVNAQQDASMLSAFSDGNALTGKYRKAAAALVQGGFVEGYAGALHISDNITRAEFVTVLYNIIAHFSVTDDDGSTIVTSDANLTGRQFSGNVYFDCTQSDIALSNVTAPTLVVRGDTLNSLLLNSCKIDRLVIAAGSGNVSIYPAFSNNIGTIVVGTGSGKITLGGDLANVEVTGDNREIVLNAQLSQLKISGSNNKVTLNNHVQDVTLLETGSGNAVTINSSCVNGLILSPDSVIDGHGDVRNLTDSAVGSQITVNALNTTTNTNYGLSNATLLLTAPDALRPYQVLDAAVAIQSAPSDLDCRGTWYLDDVIISSDNISIDASGTVSLSYDITDRAPSPIYSTLSFVLSCISTDDVYHETRVDKIIEIDGREMYTADEILSLVTTGYKGDYTLNWALENDYNPEIKEQWVNLKGYSSPSDYLIWVSTATQHVNVYTGSAGHWTLQKSFVVGTGKTSTQTPVGVFHVITKRIRGWTTTEYTVEPLINFFSLAYAFHSRLYYPNTRTVIDPRIGFPISHGCIRMYDEDVAYLFETIPVKTTVVVY